MAVRIALLFALVASAQAQHYAFRHYGRSLGLTNFGAADGLPSPGIEALHEGADGTFWVGS